MDPPRIELGFHPCHGRGLPLSYRPSTEMKIRWYIKLIYSASTGNSQPVKVDSCSNESSAEMDLPSGKTHVG